MKRWKWAWVVWALTGWILALGTTGLWAAEKTQIEKDLKQRKKDLGKVNKQLTLTKEKEEKIRGKESSILESLSTVETELYRKEKELTQMERLLAQTKSRLLQTENQITTLDQGIERTRDEFFSRMNALYKMGRHLPQQFLLTSETYLDLLRMDQYLRVILESDARIVNTYEYQRTLKGRYQGELIQDHAKSQAAITAVEKKRDEVKKVRAEQRALLRSIRDQKAVTQKVIRELEGRAKDLQTFIANLEKEKSTPTYNRPPTKALKANLIPPVQGKVISPFKERGQNGIEIQAPMGTQIRAILPGRVLYADWFKGFGNVVIIDHGDHLVTVSGYSSQLLKKAGDTVSQGEPIATVGSAGSLKGPCLYFEIRHQGKAQDPMDWIPQLDKVVSVPESKEKTQQAL